MDGTLGSQTAWMLDDEVSDHGGRAAGRGSSGSRACRVAGGRARDRRSREPRGPGRVGATRESGRRSASASGSSTRGASLPMTVSRFASLGVACSVQFSHAPSRPGPGLDHFGRPARMAANAFRSLWDSRAVVANGSTLRWRGSARSRGSAPACSTIDDRPPWRPEQQPAVEEALLASTVTPAWLCGDERRRGAPPGFLADLVVLSRDPLECPPDELETVEVVATMVSGHWTCRPSAPGTSVEREILGRDAGRRLFGEDPAGYDAARPGHAEEVYETLRDRCGLRPGSKVVEIGPGTGQATRRLIALGADPLVVLEPDPALAAFLRASMGELIEIRPTTLEAAELGGDFDLAAAASSFHWVDEDVGLARIRDALRVGGWVALWWTAFGDARRPDPFRHAVDPIMRELARSPSQAKDDGAALRARRRGPCRRARADRVRLDRAAPDRVGATWDTTGIRDLFASFSPVRVLAPDRREALLDEIARIADEEFGGQVTKPVVTALYTARKPS